MQRMAYEPLRARPPLVLCGLPTNVGIAEMRLVLAWTSLDEKVMASVGCWTGSGRQGDLKSGALMIAES